MSTTVASETMKEENPEQNVNTPVTSQAMSANVKSDLSKRAYKFWLPQDNG